VPWGRVDGARPFQGLVITKQIGPFAQRGHPAWTEDLEDWMHRETLATGKMVVRGGAARTVYMLHRYGIDVACWPDRDKTGNQHRGERGEIRCRPDGNFHLVHAGVGDGEPGFCRTEGWFG
jgi:hypothetical protein